MKLELQENWWRKLWQPVDHTNNFLLIHTFAVSAPELWFYRCPYTHLQSTMLYMVIWHEYRNVWESPTDGEVLRCGCEVGNSHHAYADTYADLPISCLNH